MSSNFFWNNDKTLVYQIGNKQYFLQGFNALIFSDLSNSSLLLEQLPSDKNLRDKLIDGLALSLATHDRQYSEPETIKFIQALWMREKRTGIKRFIDLLSKRQWKDSHWDGYRDHLNHMLKVYLTGLYLYKNCKNLRETLLDASSCNEAQFIRRWLYASTFHDIGYIFELPGPEKHNENLGFIQDFVKYFLHYHDQELTDELSELGLNTNTIDKKHNQEILSLLNLHFRDLQSLDDLGFIEDNIGDLWTKLNKLCEGTNIGKEGVSSYYRLCLAQSPKMLNGRQPFYDHGITGAMSLLYIAHCQKHILLKLGKELQAGELKKDHGLYKTGRVKVLKKIVEWAGDLDEFIFTVDAAATAIALHNIYKDAWRPEEIPWQVDLSNYWIDLKEYPLPFFLILIDILQGWDRPGFNPTVMSDKNLRGSEVVIKADDSKIYITYIDRP